MTAGWPALTLTASASENPTFTCRLCRSTRVAKVPLADDAEDEPELPLVEPEPEPEPDAAAAVVLGLAAVVLDELPVPLLALVVEPDGPVAPDDDEDDED